MIPMPSGVRVWIAAGHTDMRRGMQGLALQVQEQLRRPLHLPRTQRPTADIGVTTPYAHDATLPLIPEARSIRAPHWDEPRIG
jgi:hypothetical protein